MVVANKFQPCVQVKPLIASHTKHSTAANAHAHTFMRIHTRAKKSEKERKRANKAERRLQ
jgi:hypothetical protein